MIELEDAGVKARLDGGPAPVARDAGSIELPRFDASVADAGESNSVCDSASTQGWVLCAEEHGQCSFTGTRRVLYGLSLTEACAIKTVSNGTPCDNATFGDTAFGHGKH